MLRLGKPLYLGVAKLPLGVLVSFVYGSSLPLSLTIVHLINEDPNKLMKGFVQVYKSYEKCYVPRRLDEACR